MRSRSIVYHDLEIGVWDKTLQLPHRIQGFKLGAREESITTRRIDGGHRHRPV